MPLRPIPCARAGRSGGLPLAEWVLLALVLVAGAAFLAPRASSADVDPAQVQLADDLQVLRLAIDRYLAEHDGRPPSADPARWLAQLTGPTNRRGEPPVGDPTPAHRYGPYLDAVPPLPLGPARGAAAVADARSTPLGMPGVGWLYDPDTGRITPNLPPRRIPAGP